MAHSRSRLTRAEQLPCAKRSRTQQNNRQPVQRIPAIQRAPGLGPLVTNFMPPEATLSLQQLLGNKAVLSLLNLGEPVLDEQALEEELSGDEDPKAAFTQEVIDQIVSDIIAEQLEKYNNLTVAIKEEVPIAGAEGEKGSSTQQVVEGSAGEASSQEQAAPDQKTTKTVTKKIKVRAVYYISKHKKAHKDARVAAQFGQIADTIDDQLSELKGGSQEKGYHTLGSGRAVEVGKATPEDLEMFLDKAVKNGSIHTYGYQQGVLKKGGQLVSLSDETLRKLIQDWMYATGVGVDCSGFINIALVRAREKVRDDMRAAGVPEEDLPRSLARMQQPHLNKDKVVNVPADLRPGDVWLTRGGTHVRVVMKVFQTTDENGKHYFEIVTAESSTTGDSGPTEKWWRTRNVNKFGDDVKKNIVNVTGGGDKDGKFFRVRGMDK